MAEFLEKISQQAAKLTTLEKDDIQLETEREARITAEQEKKFQDDMERFKKTKKVLPEYENTEVPQNLSMKELRMLAERARQDAAKWHKAYVRVEQDKVVLLASHDGWFMAQFHGSASLFPDEHMAQ